MSCRVVLGRVVSGRVGLCWNVLGRVGMCRIVLRCVRLGRVGSRRHGSRWTDPGSRSPDPPESIRVYLSQKGQIFTYVLFVCLCIYVFLCFIYSFTFLFTFSCVLFIVLRFYLRFLVF